MDTRLLNVLFVAAIISLAGCTTQQGPSPSAAYIGGQNGFVVEFQADAPPKEVFDGGRYPFTAVVKIQNDGEFGVTKDKVRVTLTGVKAEEFSVTPGDLTKSPTEDMTAKRKDAAGNVIPSNPFFMEFKNLNHVQPIAGSALEYPLRADVCYNYGTTATAKLCSRSSILNPAPNGICVINEAKSVGNSGAPVQVSSLLETPRAADKIAFTFKVQHVGKGLLYRRGTWCDKSQVVRINEQKVYVKIREPLGVECVGLSGATPSEGEVTLFEGQNTVTCTVPLARPGDFEFPVVIDLNYDYEDSVSTSFVVKHAD